VVTLIQMCSGSIKSATWGAICKYDIFLYMMRGVLALNQLILIRDLCIVMRLACSGDADQDLSGLAVAAALALVRWEDATPASIHVYHAHLIFHLVPISPPPPSSTNANKHFHDCSVIFLNIS
jgi:hypothetical protein